MICSRMPALELAHQLIAELLLAAVIGGERVGDELLVERLAVDRLGREAGEVDLRGPELADLGLELAQVPLLEDVARRVGLDHAGDDLDQLLAGRLRHVLALEDLAAVAVDDPPLLVHDVVVLEHALADQEVLLLDLLLRALDRAAEHLRLEGLLLTLLVDRAEPVEDLVDALAGEEPDQVVLGGEEEARLAGVALAAGAAAELVVDAAGLVALGAADEEAARLDHLGLLGLDLGLELLDQRVERLLPSPRRGASSRACEARPRPSPPGCRRA